MLAITPETKKRQELLQKAEQYREELKRWIYDQLKDNQYIMEDGRCLARLVDQIGTPMSASALEEKLKKHFPNLVFVVNPNNPAMKMMYVRRNGALDPICAYHNGIMPEHSVMRMKEILVPREEFIRGPGIGHVNHKDLPLEKTEFVPGAGYVDQDGVPLGFRRELRPWGEEIRGWRTVLVKLVVSGIATPAQIERIFGSANRRAWAEHMGKREKSLPW